MIDSTFRYAMQKAEFTSECYSKYYETYDKIKSLINFTAFSKSPHFTVINSYSPISWLSCVSGDTVSVLDGNGGSIDDGSSCEDDLEHSPYSELFGFRA